MTQLSTVLGLIATVAVLIGGVWRGLRGLHRFIDAVTSNTASVERLATELHSHTTTTTTALGDLDRRLTVLELTP